MNKRFIPPCAEHQSIFVHCITRVVDKAFVLQRVERDMMMKIIRKYEAFCGVKVISHCCMSNHIHLLLEVPAKKKGAPIDMSDEEFLQKLKALYSPEAYRDCESMLRSFREGMTKSDIAAEEYKAKFTRRMHDLSEFMKGVKQSFSRWFNRTHNRAGTLWESRFKSIIVEDGYALRMVAAYIDLNPVRADMVKRPEDYRWSSYGEAMKPKADLSRELARAGICRVLGKYREVDELMAKEKSVMEWEEGAAERYRMMLFSDGEEVFMDNSESGKAGEIRKPVRKGFERKEVAKVLDRGGKLSFGETLRCRVRYLSDGLAVGSQEFVDDLFEQSRELFGAKRKSGARVIREVDWKEKETRLYTMRQLKKDVIE